MGALVRPPTRVRQYSVAFQRPPNAYGAMLPRSSAQPLDSRRGDACDIGSSDLAVARRKVRPGQAPPIAKTFLIGRDDPLASPTLPMTQSMPEPPIHPDNAAQAEFWSRPVGLRWLDRQQWQDAMLRPVDECLSTSASPRAGERVIDVGCGCRRDGVRFRSPGRAGRRSRRHRRLGAVARPRPRALPGAPSAEICARRRHNLPIRAEFGRPCRFTIWRHVLRRSVARLRQFARGAASRRTHRVRLLARRQAQSMDDDSAAGSPETRPSASGDRPRGSWSVLVCERSAGPQYSGRSGVRRDRRDAARRSPRHRRRRGLEAAVAAALYARPHGPYAGRAK